MNKFTLLFTFLFYITVIAECQTIKQKPCNIIFDTDMGPDYDDVGAIAILHAMADKGEAKILATMASTNYEGVAGVLSVFNTYFKRPNTPIGVPKGYALSLRDTQHWTDTVLAKYPHQLKTNSEAEDAVKLYRKILAAQPDGSVTIVSVGFLTNLANLLQSGADEYSALSGQKLVQKKVKLLVSMAGKFPSGWEFNVMKDATASQHAFDNWPTPVILSGFEIGEKIKTGLPLINNAAIKNSPVKDVFSLSIPKAAEDSTGRKSWDETAVLVAVRGYSAYYTLHKGKITVANEGNNAWDDGGTLHAYLVEKMPAKKVEDIINDLMMHQPKMKP
ncbi:nucleoside hydrolase [Mucilaginibacter sp.]|jgi:inosine-uridine nucleoside N-ribohydrolase|uniref:nucleoside hydrolase n=1 Tax=Mucilaginibacter sp. TaxID=1882438 RepID=UPI0035667CE8